MPLRHYITRTRAQMVELVDTPDLGSGAHAWGFESLFGHQKLNKITFFREGFFMPFFQTVP